MHHLQARKMFRLYLSCIEILLLLQADAGFPSIKIPWPSYGGCVYLGPFLHGYLTYRVFLHRSLWQYGLLYAVPPCSKLSLVDSDLTTQCKPVSEQWLGPWGPIHA